MEEIYNAKPEELAELRKYNVSSELISLLSDKSTLREENILNWCLNNRITVITKDDEIYPKALRALRDPPTVLYCKGKMPDLNFNLSIGVVGTRKMSDYGKNIAYEMGRGLSAGGATLISGMALGIDGMAMSGALDAGGTTVAVLGCGIDKIYPREHAHLFDRILKKGAVITEYPPGTPPAGVNFPIRNRIISGISQGVVVVEADMKSGALITARHAIYQAREVFAVPGQIKNENSSGTNYLIKEGVFVATCAEDVLEKYTFLYPHSVNLQAAQMYGTSTMQQSDDGAKRNKIASSDSASAQSKSFYGSGLYGGKASEFEKKTDIKFKDRPTESSQEAKPQKSPVIDFSKIAYTTPVQEPQSTPPKTDSENNNEFKKYIRQVSEDKLTKNDTIPTPILSSENKKINAPERLMDFYGEGLNINRLSNPKDNNKKPDQSKLSEKEQEILNIMPEGEPVTAEWFTAKGFAVSTTMSSMTMLEIYGLIKSNPGGTFIKL